MVSGFRCQVSGFRYNQVSVYFDFGFKGEVPGAWGMGLFEFGSVNAERGNRNDSISEFRNSGIQEFRDLGIKILN
jgi:hypothetical protein